MNGRAFMVAPAVALILALAAGIGWLAWEGLLTLVRMITGGA